MSKSNKYLIIHHTDPDGWCSAAIARKFFLEMNPNAEITFCTYNYRKGEKANSMIEKFKNDNVCIVDVSIHAENLNDFSNILKLPKENFTWVDHHITSKNWVESSGFKFHGVVSEIRSAAYLAWEYFYHFREMPNIVKLVDDHDRYIHAIKGSYEMSGASTLDQDFAKPDSELWETLLKSPITEESEEACNRIIKLGTTVKGVLDADSAIAMKVSSIEFYLKVAFGDTVHYLKCSTINRGGGSSIFGSDISGWDIVIPWIFTRTFEYKYTLFTSSEQLNTSTLSRKFKGGGHKKASGFSLSKNMVEKIKKVGTDEAFVKVLDLSDVLDLVNKIISEQEKIIDGKVDGKYDIDEVITFAEEDFKELFNGDPNVMTVGDIELAARGIPGIDLGSIKPEVALAT